MSLDRRRKGIYLRAICGIRKAIIQNKRIVFLTLTTGDCTADGLDDSQKMELISKSWNTLATFLKQRFGKFETLTVITNEGNGVIHVLCSGIPFIYEKRLVRLWNQIHGSQILYIEKFYGSPESISNYIMSQYVTQRKATMFRFKMSNNWICKKFSYYWRVIKRCSRDYTKSPVDYYGYKIYPLNRAELVPNFDRWLRYYIKRGEQLEYIPSYYDLQ